MKERLNTSIKAGFIPDKGDIDNYTDKVISNLRDVNDILIKGGRNDSTVTISKWIKDINSISNFMSDIVDAKDKDEIIWDKSMDAAKTQTGSSTRDRTLLKIARDIYSRMTGIRLEKLLTEDSNIQQNFLDRNDTNDVIELLFESMGDITKLFGMLNELKGFSKQAKAYKNISSSKIRSGLVDLNSIHSEIEDMFKQIRKRPSGKVVL